MSGSSEWRVSTHCCSRWWMSVRRGGSVSSTPGRICFRATRVLDFRNTPRSPTNAVLVSNSAFYNFTVVGSRMTSESGHAEHGEILLTFISSNFSLRVPGAEVPSQNVYWLEENVEIVFSELLVPWIISLFYMLIYLIFWLYAILSYWIMFRFFHFLLCVKRIIFFDYLTRFRNCYLLWKCCSVKSSTKNIIKLNFWQL